MKIKLFLVFVLFSQLPMYIFSQDQQGHRRVYDIGLTFSSLNSFGINFKVGNQKTLLRITGLMLNFNSDKWDEIYIDTVTYNNKTANIGFGLRIGFEKQIVLAKNFNLILGSDAGLAYTYVKTKRNDNNYSWWEIKPGIFLVAGVAYQLGEHFIITGELSPSFSYYYREDKDFISGMDYQSGHGFEFGFSNGSASITIAYRISKIIFYKD